MAATFETSPRSGSVIMDTQEIKITTTQQLASACTGALLTAFIVTPLDVVKVRLQTQAKTMLSNKCYLYCNGLMDHLCPCAPCDSMPNIKAGQATYLTGTIDALAKITRYEGLQSLWSGLSPTLILAVPSTVVYFVTYENLRLFIKDRNKGVLPFWGPLLAGVCARLWAASIVSPVELVRTKMQSQKLSYGEMHETMKAQMKSRGIMGLFRGLGPTLLRDVPFSGIYWLSYETFKSRFGSDPPLFLTSFIGGALAGSIAATVTTPFDVIKTHQQTDIGEKEIYSDPPKRGASMSTIIRRIYQQNGVPGLFIGLIPRIARVAPSCAIMISTFEYGKKFFHRYNKLQSQKLV